MDQSCVQLVLQPVAKGTLHFKKERMDSITANKFRKQIEQTSEILQTKTETLLEGMSNLLHATNLWHYHFIMHFDAAIRRNKYTVHEGRVKGYVVVI